MNKKLTLASSSPSPIGIVRSDPVTAAAQVASRYVAVWGVQYPFPELCQSPVYSTMLFAWSVTEVIRYSFLALKLLGFEPAAFVWLRYSSYLILYPLGITSEMIQMWRALEPAKPHHSGLRCHHPEPASVLGAIPSHLDPRQIPTYCLPQCRQISLFLLEW